MSRHERKPASFTSSSGSPYTSRTSYPAFLPFQDTTFLHLRAAGHGLLDATRWDIVIRLVASDPEIRSNVFKSLLLNVVSLSSIYFFDLLLHPLARDQPHWLHRNVGWFYQVLWLLPVVGVAFYLNSSWCTIIAKRTFTLQHGSRAAVPQPSTYTGILKSVATSAYRVIMVFTSVVISFTLAYLPMVGPFAGFIFLCWVDAYYCFEFIWVARGLSLSRRLRHLEERWAYYFAFGLPTAAFCMWGSTLANAAIFALVFPAYIIMAMHARPLPLDPYNPTGSDVIKHPSPYIPIRIPIFLPVTFLNDWIIRIINFGTRAAGGRSAPRIRSHQRSLTDDGVESVEEGEAIDLEPLRSAPLAPPTGRARVRVPRRGSRGDSRRKLD